jgi:DNA-binding XRE family transcriptional regulator
MSMAKKFETLVQRATPAVRAKAEILAQDMIRDMALDELREARALTQEHLAKILRINQSAVSKMERRADMYVSSLQDFVKALGGTLEIRAVFPQGTVRISQFRDLGGSPVARKTTRGTGQRAAGGV